MDPNDNAKYLNSPETELFDKGRSLYNVKEARTAAGKGMPLVVAEGYMDVIALHGAGFEAAVAPLGTAITENQLQMLWRIAPEPIITLDGDTAGQRAAMRLIDLALPLLEAGQSLRFAVMPEGMDPDDLLKSQGAGALQKLLDAAMPMVRLLWQRETDGRVFDSPERKAALEKTLFSKVALISDDIIRKNYQKEIKDLLWKEFSTWSNRKTGKRAYQVGASMLASPTAKQSYLADHDAEKLTQEIREAAILALSIESPEACVDQSHKYEALEFIGPFHEEIKSAVVLGAPECIGVSERFRRRLDRILGPEKLDRIYSYSHVQLIIDVLEPNNPTAAAKAISGEFRKIHAERGMQQEVSEAEHDIQFEDASEGITYRLSQARSEYDSSLLVTDGDTSESEIAANGIRLDSREKSDFDKALEEARNAKPSKRRT